MWSQLAITNSLCNILNLPRERYIVGIEELKEQKDEKSQRLLRLDEELASDQCQLRELHKEFASLEINWKKKKSCLEVNAKSYNS